MTLNWAKSKKLIAAPLILILATVTYTLKSTSEDEASTSYIVNAKNSQALQQAFNKLGITPTHHLSLIDSFAINLTKSQLILLEADVAISITKNHQVELAGWAKGKRRWQPSADANLLIEADKAHKSGIYGENVTIAVLDTGLDQLSGLSKDLRGRDKVWGTYDAINNAVFNFDREQNGHGTHVASLAVNSDFDINGRIYGIAPNAALVGIKAFDSEGKSTYADVIRGIEWAVGIKDKINLRVLNMSFSGPAQSYYWEDPLNQAVMKAWQAGIVVVASAGNGGPDPMTIGVPGNIPYIITVGAMTDNYTPSDKSDDKLASFSAAGPTIEGFVKPEIVAPGGHISGLMAFDSAIVAEHPEYHDGGRYFEMSGTSQAAGVVSGAVALMLSNNPSLTPDQIKCQLIASARPAINAQSQLAYSVFQQGAGVVNVADALASDTSCLTTTMDIAKDLANEQHYVGPAFIDEQGNFSIKDGGDFYSWKVNEEVLNGDGFIWRTSFDIDGFIWRTSFDTNTDLQWRSEFETDGFIWRTNIETDGFIWRTSVDIDPNASIKINAWVDQQ